MFWDIPKTYCATPAKGPPAVHLVADGAGVPEISLIV